MNTKSYQNDKLEEVKIQIADVTQIMQDNINKTIKRGEDIEQLVDKTDVLEKEASKFNRLAKDVRRHYMCKNIKMNLIIASIIIAIVVFLVLIIYFSVKH